MRDSQSLLEQLLAFSPGRITVADVHGMLGTAGEERLAAMLGHLIERNPAGALADLDGALTAGVDPALLIEQLFGHLRDCMVAAVGCPTDAFLYTSPSGAKNVVEAGKQLGLDALLAIMQILDQTLSRMRYSTQGRILAELALVRICHLEDFEELSEVILRLQSGVGQDAPGPSTATGMAAKKKLEPALASRSTSAGLPAAVAGSSNRVGTVGQDNRDASDSTANPPQGVDSEQLDDDQSPSDELDQGVQGMGGTSRTVVLTAENAMRIWDQALSRVSGIAADQAGHFDSVAIPAPNRLVIRFKPAYDVCKSVCERPEQVAKFERALAEVTGQRIRLEFALTADAQGPQGPAPTTARSVSPHQRLLEVRQHPLVHRAAELFGAEPFRVDDPSSRE